MARKKIEWVPEMAEAIRSVPYVPTRDESLQRLIDAIETAKASAKVRDEENRRCLPVPLAWRHQFFWIAVLVGAQLVALWLS